MNVLCSRFALVLLSAFSLTVIQAQSPTPANTQRCGFESAHQRMMSTNVHYAERIQTFDELMRTGIAVERDGGPFVVPVVVHVMGAGNALTEISDEQVRDAIRNLNQRFRKVPGTLGDGSGVDLGVEFALAARDPQGNCTDGITRTDLSGYPAYVSYGMRLDGAIGMMEGAVKDLDRWDPLRYYNIWVVNEIDDNDGGFGTQGFAYFAAAHGQAYDGMVILCNSLKDPTSSTLTHELGHALNLYHTFEGDANGTACPPNTNCATQGDQVCDTPPHIRSASNCLSGGTNACNGGSSNSLYVFNYMDYSSCRDGFTAGQSARTGPALTTQRASFLAVNGNLSLVPPTGSAPSMDLVATGSLLCGTGQNVTFLDHSSCIPNTFLENTDMPGISFAWTVTNGVVTYNSTSHNPTFTLGQAGVYNATLAITTANGTFSRTEQGIVVVATAPVAACAPTTGNAGNYVQTVSNVKFNTIDNSTSVYLNTAYTDFSCSQNTTVSSGGTYPLSITINAGGSAAESLNAYIDYNNNGVFEDPGERVATGSQPANGSSTVVANVTIPTGAVTNTLLRMRIYGEAGTLSASERTCGSALFIGDVEDYGIYISNSIASVSIAAAPGSTITYGTSVTFTPTPVNGGGAPTYAWSRNGDPAGTSATYQSSNLLPGETIQCEMTSNLAGVIASPALSNTINMVVTGPPLSAFVASATATCAGSGITFSDKSMLSPTSWSWGFPGGTPATSSVQNPVVSYAAPGTYTVTLTASNGFGTGTIATQTNLVTVYATPPTACAVTRTNAPVAGIGITNVTLNSINNTTAYDDAVMNNFSCTAFTPLQPSTNYPISVTVGNSNDQWVRVYIDYDNNGTFSAGELVFSPANGTGVRSGNFTTPASPTAGTLLRMRVITDFVNTTPGACTSPVQYGQVEEYAVVFNPPAAVQLAAHAFLDGPYKPNTGLMIDGLRGLATFPLTEPYTALGYAHTGGGGGETIQPSVLTITGNNAIVDWVVLELRNASASSTVLASRSALLQRDGDVVDVDGVSAVSFDRPPANYYVALLHRNHLSVMTSASKALGATPLSVDFTSNGTTTYGTDARRSVAGAFPAQVLWSGNTNFDAEVKYVGGGNDRDPILFSIGGTIPTSTITGYRMEDVNMDGVVKYSGAENDRDPILQNIGGTIPTSTRAEQMP